MHRLHPPLPTPIKIPPKQRPALNIPRRRQLAPTIEEPTPLLISPRPVHADVRELRPAILAVRLENREEGCQAISRPALVCEPVGVWREVLAGLVACDLHVESCGGAVALKVGGAVENGLHEGFVLGEVGGGAGSGGG